ncbi:MAG: cob(I)yrinic acid a,c-diamide adenosyltransferase [Deltaproteobacteria bacterium]|nr:cob(I)yrinic acid a,c-diamide adenosyltransferase [Deltaproteobacteria bacterium]
MNDHIEKGTEKHDRGLVMVLTGDGKGKTTSALGQALRAVGHGFKVYMIQFMKGRKYGEVIAAEKHLPDLTVEQFGLDSFVMRDNPAPVDIELAQEGLERAQEIIASDAYDMVILDEINVALDFKLVSLDEVLELIKNKPVRLTLILTGRYAPLEIVEIADMVSEVKEIKHHYASGIKDRPGIEF